MPAQKKVGPLYMWRLCLFLLSVLVSTSFFVCALFTTHNFPLPLYLFFSLSIYVGIAASLTSLPHGQSKRAFPGKTASTVRTWTISWIPNWSLVPPHQARVTLIQLPVGLWSQALALPSILLTVALTGVWLLWIAMGKLDITVPTVSSGYPILTTQL